MAGNVSIKDNTPAVVRLVTSLSKEALISFTEQATGRVKQYAPVDTSEHKKAIHWEPIAKNSTRIFSSSGYGKYLEFGTSRMQAQPHFKPAIMQIARIYKNNKLWK